MSFPSWNSQAGPSGHGNANNPQGGSNVPQGGHQPPTQAPFANQTSVAVLPGTRRYALTNVDPRYRELEVELPGGAVTSGHTSASIVFSMLPGEIRNAIYHQESHHGLIEARRGYPNTIHADSMYDQPYRDSGGMGTSILDIGNQGIYQEAARLFYRSQEVAVTVESHGFRFIPPINTPLATATFPIREQRLYIWLMNVPLRYSPRFNPIQFFRGQHVQFGQPDPMAVRRAPDFGLLRSIRIELETNHPHGALQVEQLMHHVEAFVRVLARCEYVERVIVSVSHHAHWVARAINPPNSTRVWVPFRRYHEDLRRQGNAMELRIAQLHNVPPQQRDLMSDLENVVRPFVGHPRSVGIPPLSNVRRLDLELPEDLQGIREFEDIANGLRTEVQGNYRGPA